MRLLIAIVGYERAHLWFTKWARKTCQHDPKTWAFLGFRNETGCNHYRCTCGEDISVPD